MSGSKSRTKGAAAEREVVQLFRDYLGIKLQRNLQQSINGGFDIQAGGNPLTSSLAIEVKHHKTATQAQVSGWWKQACDQAGGGIPVLFFRADRQAWRVMIGAEWLNPDFSGKSEVVIIETSLFFLMVREERFISGSQLREVA